MSSAQLQTIHNDFSNQSDFFFKFVVALVLIWQRFCDVNKADDNHLLRHQTGQVTQQNVIFVINYQHLQPFLRLENIRLLKPETCG